MVVVGGGVSLVMVGGGVAFVVVGGGVSTVVVGGGVVGLVVGLLSSTGAAVVGDVVGSCGVLVDGAVESDVLGDSDGLGLGSVDESGMVGAKVGFSDGGSESSSI